MAQKGANLIQLDCETLLVIVARMVARVAMVMRLAVAVGCGASGGGAGTGPENGGDPVDAGDGAGDGGDNGSSDGEPADTDGGSGEPLPCAEPGEYCGVIPLRAVPCDDEQKYWPLTARSQLYPVQVHYSQHAQRADVDQIIDEIDRAWQIEVKQLGFSPPLPDRGICGADDDFDVFVWPGQPEVFVEAIADQPSTPHDDWITYMGIDPHGPYGGALLGATIAHELNHACQASDDWFESALIFEMTATFVEDVVHPQVDDWMTILADFQSHPDWSLDRDDGYETWYMYSSALYLHFLRDRYAGNNSFVADLWRGMRSSAAGPNEPDFEDAIDSMLAGHGSDFISSVVEFSRWRWYTGARDDGKHFEEGASYPANAEVAIAATATATPQSIAIDPAPMILGSGYVVIERAGGAATVELSLTADRRATWVVQALPGPGNSDGEVLDLSKGRATVDLSEHATRVVVVTALPSGQYDVDERRDRRYAVTIDIR